MSSGSPSAAAPAPAPIAAAETYSGDARPRPRLVRRREGDLRAVRRVARHVERAQVLARCPRASGRWPRRCPPTFSVSPVSAPAARTPAACRPATARTPARPRSPSSARRPSAGNPLQHVRHASSRRSPARSPARPPGCSSSSCHCGKADELVRLRVREHDVRVAAVAIRHPEVGASVVHAGLDLRRRLHDVRQALAVGRDRRVEQERVRRVCGVISGFARAALDVVFDEPGRVRDDQRTRPPLGLAARRRLRRAPAAGVAADPPPLPPHAATNASARRPAATHRCERRGECSRGQPTARRIDAASATRPPLAPPPSCNSRQQRSTVARAVSHPKPRRCRYAPSLSRNAR